MFSAAGAGGAVLLFAFCVLLLVVSVFFFFGKGEDDWVVRATIGIMLESGSALSGWGLGVWIVVGFFYGGP